MRYSLQKSFIFNIPKPEEGEKLLKRGFEEDGLSLFINEIQEKINTSLENHPILLTAAAKSFLELTIEFIKNSIDAGATKVWITFLSDPINKKTIIFIADDGHGFQDAAQRGSCIWQETLLRPSQKAASKTDEAGKKLAYGGAGLGNAMAAHFNEKYGHAEPGRGFRKRNRFSSDERIPGALIILESNDAICLKNIETAEGEYLKEMRRDLMLHLCEKFGVSKDDQSLLRDDTFELFLEKFKKTSRLSDIQERFLEWVKIEKQNREEEKEREQAAAREVSPLQSSSLGSSSFASGNYSTSGNGSSTKTGMKKRLSFTLSPLSATSASSAPVSGAGSAPTSEATYSLPPPLSK